MKIFNEDKTIELNESDIDLEKGYLKADKLFITHHEAVEGGEAIYNRRIETLPNGSTQVWKDLITPAAEAKDAYDEYEDIQVYVLYTHEQIKENLRGKRVPLLTAFDKWEKAVLRERELDDDNIMNWYQDLLDLKESAIKSIPLRIKYYL